MLTLDSVNVYVIPGPKATRLTRLTREKVESGDLGFSIECTFLNPESKPKKARKKAEKKVVDIDEVDADTDVDDPSTSTPASTSKATAKTKRQVKKESAENNPSAKLRSKKRRMDDKMHSDDHDDHDDHDHDHDHDGQGDGGALDDHDEYEDLRDLELYGWDADSEVALDSDDLDGAQDYKRIPRNDSDGGDDASSDRENGWKVVNGSMATRPAQGASKWNAIVLSD